MEVKSPLSLDKPGDDKNQDTFAKAKLDKKERQSKNELQKLRNIARARKIQLPRAGLPTTKNFPNSQQLSEAMTVARMSTASVGKFQDKYISYIFCCVNL